MFIPQKPYMTLGSLREQICYPHDPTSYDDDVIREVIDKACLSNLSVRFPDLDIKHDWSRLLSLGEQQRVAFARIFLNTPKYVVLDESTSALDVRTEKHLYDSLVSGGVGYVSVGHRLPVIRYHEKVLVLDGNGSHWNLKSVSEYDPKEREMTFDNRRTFQ